MSFFKRFSFFTQRDAREHGVPANATCVACARAPGSGGGLGHAYAGTDAGAVVVLAPPAPASSSTPSSTVPAAANGGLAALGAFAAHGHRVLQIAYADRLDQVVTLGLEEPGVSSATVKVWDAARLRRALLVSQQQTQQQQTQQQRPPPMVPLPPLRVQRVFSASAKRPESEATCLAATEDVSPLLTVAVGLANGGVYVFQGDTSVAMGGGGGGGASGSSSAATAAGAPTPATTTTTRLPSPRGGANPSPSTTTQPLLVGSGGAAQGLQCIAKLVARPDSGDLWAVTRMFFAMAAPPYQQRQEQFRLLLAEEEERRRRQQRDKEGAGATGGSTTAQQQPQQPSSNNNTQGSSATATTATRPPAADLLRVDASALWSGVPSGVGSLVADGPRANALAERQERLHLYVVTESQTLCFRVHDGSRSVLEPRGLGAQQGGLAGGAAAATLRPAEVRVAVAEGSGLVDGDGAHPTDGDGDEAAATAAAAAAAASSAAPAPPPLLVVGRDDALYDYTLDTRAGCTVFAGRKLWLSTALGRYLVLVTAAGAAGGGQGGAGGEGGAGGGGGDNDDGGGGGASTATTRRNLPSSSPSATQACTLTFLDVRHKLIAGSFVLPSPVRHVLAPSSAVAAPAAGSAAPSSSTLTSTSAAPPPALAVVLANGRAVAFYEAAQADRVDALLRRSLHRTALEVARAGGADAGALAAIHRAWGDHLYARGEFDAAMAQYLETPPPWLEASYVVRRFLDAQRVALLARYLGSLHSKGLAGPDHTTLLLSCYAKLKDVAKLDAFVHQPAAAAGGSGATANQQLPFDAETAFRVLRGAGYYEHALAVARRATGGGGGGGGSSAGRVDWALSVLLEDLAAHDRALQFVEALPRPQRAEALRRYGRPLVAARLEDATRLLMDLCVAPPPGGGGGGNGPSSSSSQYVASVADFAHLFADRPVALTLLCEYVLNSAPGADGAGPAPPPGAGVGGGGVGVGSQQQAGSGNGSTATSGNNSLRALYHTLLELYLSDEEEEQEEKGKGEEAEGAAASSSTAAAAASAAAASSSRRDKARDLLARGWQPHMLHSPAYDPQHALALCRLRRFTPGLVFLYDRLRLPRELLRVHMASRDAASVVRACAEHGDASRGGDPQLWADALDYLCSLPDPPEQYVREVLRRAGGGGGGGGGQQQQQQQQQQQGGGGAASAAGHGGGPALSPLAVLQALARNPKLPVSLVRDYVARELERDARAAEADRAAVARLAAETAALRAEAARLRTRPRVFQNSRCAASGAPLELPVAHFMCGHSFNLRSLGDSDRECPLCAPELARALDVQRHLRRGAGEQDAFFRALREQAAGGDGGFGVVAEHFGRGLMNCTAAAVARDLKGRAAARDV